MVQWHSLPHRSNDRGRTFCVCACLHSLLFCSTVKLLHNIAEGSHFVPICWDDGIVFHSFSRPFVAASCSLCVTAAKKKNKARVSVSVFYLISLKLQTITSASPSLRTPAPTCLLSSINRVTHCLRVLQPATVTVVRSQPSSRIIYTSPFSLLIFTSAIISPLHPRLKMIC